MISTQDLQAIVARTRAAAAKAGELKPVHVGPLVSDLPAEVRRAIAEDLASGEYRRAVDEAVAGDPDLAQGLRRPPW